MRRLYSPRRAPLIDCPTLLATGRAGRALWPTASTSGASDDVGFLDTPNEVAAAEVLIEADAMACRLPRVPARSLAHCLVADYFHRAARPLVLRITRC
jgi:hypothetical protein